MEFIIYNPCELNVVKRSLNGEKTTECQKPEIVSRQRPEASIAPLEAGH